VVLLGNDLSPIGHRAVQGLVVLHPGGGQALVGHVGGAVEYRRLASCIDEIIENSISYIS